MNPDDPNTVSVELVAHHLGPLIDELVLVGGCAVGLLITDTARPPIRQTGDVDLVAEIASMADYYKFSSRIRECGFHEHSDVICRWRKGALLLDVMPSVEIGVGATNRWYRQAVAESVSTQLPSGMFIRLITAPLFVATKLEAFHDRGNGDYLHHDMEDIVNLVDGRKELADEVSAASDDVRDFIREEMEDLLTNDGFMQQLPLHLRPAMSEQARLPIIIERLRKLAGL